MTNRTYKIRGVVPNVERNACRKAPAFLKNGKAIILFFDPLSFFFSQTHQRDAIPKKKYRTIKTKLHGR